MWFCLTGGGGGGANFKDSKKRDVFTYSCYVHEQMQWELFDLHEVTFLIMFLVY
jgi:hypothetical protein